MHFFKAVSGSLASDRRLYRLASLRVADYIDCDFGRAEDRFPWSNPGEEESPNSIGRDAA